MNRHVDEGAEQAGRAPRHRAGSTSAPSTQPSERWAEQLAGLALEYGMSGFILASDDAGTLERFAREVAPAVREAVAAAR